MIINISDDMIELNQAGLLKKLLVDKTTKGHILWGTDAYRERGPAFEREREIDRALLLYENTGLIKTRARKAFEQQSERTKQHGEVFTPRWICDLMIDHLDEEWFGVEEIDFLSSMDDLFAKKKWKKYVDSRRLEITCGEGPFLVQRYDVSTGNMIPVPERKGILDRKLQAVSRYAETEEEWKTWAKRSFQAVYGYEFQGDNLLISRVNFMMTYRDFYKNRWQKEPELSEWEKIANIITWNLWQMDGLTGEIPYSRMDPLGPSLFELGDPDFKEEDLHPACRIYDWRNEKKSVIFNEIGKRKKGMKFDYIIGNPPYQKSDGGNKASALPLYNVFIEGIIQQVNPHYLSLIIPSRWYSGGRGLDKFRKFMMNDGHIKSLHDYQNAGECFPGMDISGGICYFLRDSQYSGPCNVINEGENSMGGVLKRSLSEFPIVIGDNNAVSIIRNILSLKEDALSTKVSTQRPFGLRTYARPTDKGDLLLKWNHGIGAIERKDITLGQDMIDKWKVIVSRVFYEHAGKADKDGKCRVLSILDVLSPKTVCTETYLVVDSFDDKEEAKNLRKYLESKFARFLILQASSSIMITKNSFIFVPLQDFTSHSDIDWSKSIPEIDRQLYRKYGLDEKEISFIESHVKEMK